MSVLTLKQLQDQFIASLAYGDSDIESAIVDQGSITLQTRLGIYQNAYRVRLKETIETDHRDCK